MKILFERIVDAFSEDRDLIVGEATSIMKSIKDIRPFIELFQKVLDKTMGMMIAIPAFSKEDLRQVGASYGYDKTAVRSTHEEHGIGDCRKLMFTLTHSNQGKPDVTGSFSFQKVEIEKLRERGSGNEYAQTIEIVTKSDAEYSVTITESKMLGIKGGGDTYIKIAKV